MSRPLAAYGLAVAVELVAVLLTVPVLALFPDFGFRGAIIILGVVGVALTLSGGSGLLASLTGTLPLEFALPPSFLSFSLEKRSDLVGVLFYLGVCLATNMATSHRTRIPYGTLHQVASV